MFSHKILSAMSAGMYVMKISMQFSEFICLGPGFETLHLGSWSRYKLLMLRCMLA